MSQHQDFILSPLSSVLDEAMRVLPSMKSGIEKRELCGYVLQSLFLKATGFQEQKMKCIAWEMATVDYEYRFDEFKKIIQNECSTIDTKQNILKEVVSQICLHNADFNGIDDSKIQSFIDVAHAQVSALYSHTMLHSWNQRNEYDFETIYKGMRPDYVVKSNDKSSAHKIFDPKPIVYNGEKQSYYFFVYSHRNRCAHNTLSYQQNLPSLSSLASQPFAYDNFYVLLFVLLILDQYVVDMYKNYKALTSDFEA